MASSRRAGLTAIELIVVIAIMGVLLALALAGLARVRAAAARAESSVRLKQIVLALHHFGDRTGGALPETGDVEPVSNTAYSLVLFPIVNQPSILTRLLPYLEERDQNTTTPLSLFVSPADPTAQAAVASGKAVASYAANGQVFWIQPRLPGTFRDGTSNTIAFAEHYGVCGENTFLFWESSLSAGTLHRPSFADAGDVMPRNWFLWPTKTVIPEVTYQVAPSDAECYSAIAQTPHRSGMLVALADGTVRQISPGISNITYWAAVLPDDGALLGSDW